MINIKSGKDIESMKKGGVILKEVLETVLTSAIPGVSLIALDGLAEKLILERGGSPAFKKVEDYKWTICCAVNDVVVHGIPNDYVLQEGDVVGIDCGVIYEGFNTDCAWTKIITNGNYKDPEKEKFLKAGQTALYNALAQVKEYNHIYDISKAINDEISKQGYSVVRTLVGHGVGRKLHEDPEIPGFAKQKREDTALIKEGMVFAVEVIYNMGKHAIKYKGNDGWTLSTKDGKISGLFEETVAVSSHGSLVLTPVNPERIGTGSRIK